uniref:Uncharacterized protein n=1 Tax=Glossina palpalis gambiensis TaxID=67801 RepID=A0A1B0B6G3_9MUSC
MCLDMQMYCKGLSYEKKSMEIYGQKLGTENPLLRYKSILCPISNYVLIYMGWYQMLNERLTDGARLVLVGAVDATAAAAATELTELSAEALESLLPERVLFFTAVTCGGTGGTAKCLYFVYM